MTLAIDTQIGRAPPSTISCLSLYLLAAKCLHLTGRPVHPERYSQKLWMSQEREAAYPP